MKTVKFHTSKDATWRNASGDVVPVKFVPKTDKHKELIAAKIFKAALSVESALKALHELMNEAYKEVTAMVREEYELKYEKKQKEGKGSFTWYNFDKSLKVEAEVNEIVRWDSALMTEALSLLNKYISGSLSESNELIKQLVNDAFSNTKGMIDTRKVYQLLKYEKNIKNASFQKACQLIKNASTIDRTKMYQRIWYRDERGEYKNINLNFSQL